MATLFINACVRENSRTKILADNYLQKTNTNYEEIVLKDINLAPLDTKRLELRERLVGENRFDDAMFDLAWQFAKADEIVIAAPFWDLSFPSFLKIYLENVTVSGITFRYQSGKPKGLCNAKKLTYITTSGGPIFQDFGYSYVKSLATNFYHIQEVVCLRVENLDIKGVVGDDVLKEDIQTIL